MTAPGRLLGSPLPNPPSLLWAGSASVTVQSLHIFWGSSGPALSFPQLTHTHYHSQRAHNLVFPTLVDSRLVLTTDWLLFPGGPQAPQTQSIKLNPISPTPVTRIFSVPKSPTNA